MTHPGHNLPTFTLVSQNTGREYGGSRASRGAPVERSGVRDDGSGMTGQGRDNALDHVVVVVFENRSLDNVLGRLYGPGDGKTFEGVTGKDLTNPIPDWAEHGAGQNAYINAAHRVHARVEDAIRTGEDAGLGHFL